MKNLKYLFLFLGILISIQSFGQKPKETDKISALRLKKEIAQEYHKGVTVATFTVDKKGIVRAKTWL